MKGNYTCISGFLLINAASLCVSLTRGSDEAGGIRNSVIMPQAVKGNEGRYSGLLLHDHPKTHPRINEGAGGRLISLYCGAAGTGGVGRSGLKPALNPLETWQLWRTTVNSGAPPGPHLLSALALRPFTGCGHVRITVKSRLWRL